MAEQSRWSVPGGAIPMRDVMVGSFAGVGLAAAIFLVAAWPADGRPVVALFPPSYGTPELVSAVARADGAIVALDTGSRVLISLGAGSGYARALYAAGAWLVLDAAAASLCMTVPPRHGPAA